MLKRASDTAAQFIKSSNGVPQSRGAEGASAGSMRRGRGETAPAKAVTTMTKAVTKSNRRV